jgi:hypothetical protein
MKKSFVLAIAIIFSFFFFACEEEAIPVMLPPPPATPAAGDLASLEPSDTVKSAVAPVASSSSAKPVSSANVAKRIPVVESIGNSEQLNSGRYTIQIAIFPNEASARALVRKMDRNGIKAYYARVCNPAKLLGSYYRVRIGFFNGKSVAEHFAQTRLEPLGYAWWIDERRNDNLGNTAVQNDTSTEIKRTRAVKKTAEASSSEVSVSSSSAVSAPTLPNLKIPLAQETAKEVEVDSKGKIKVSDKK